MFTSSLYILVKFQVFLKNYQDKLEVSLPALVNHDLVFVNN